MSGVSLKQLGWRCTTTLVPTTTRLRFPSAQLVFRQVRNSTGSVCNSTLRQWTRAMASCLPFWKATVPSCSTRCSRPTGSRCGLTFRLPATLTTTSPARKIGIAGQKIVVIGERAARRQRLRSPIQRDMPGTPVRQTAGELVPFPHRREIPQHPHFRHDGIARRLLRRRSRRDTDADEQRRALEGEAGRDRVAAEEVLWDIGSDGIEFGKGGGVTTSRSASNVSPLVTPLPRPRGFSGTDV